LSHDDWGWYKPAPKRPPPQRGIKVKKSGTTWWGQRWVEALERMSRSYSNRLPRGRSYARAGRTHDLVVQSGKVTAKVTGSRPKPYDVIMVLAKLDDAAWELAIAMMAGRAQFAAELLSGEMPRNIDAAFGETGRSLFPVKASDLVTRCSCPDSANPCKHIAATHYVLGEALDRDPFLLFELRGRTEAQVLEALRSARVQTGDAGKTRTGAKRPAASPEYCSGIVLAKLDAADYERAPAPLPSLRLTFEPPPSAGSLLRQLGNPPGWGIAHSSAELFAPVIRAAAKRARSIAMAEVQQAPDPDSA
jgi:uncharacterized Zn finger protein